MAEIRRIVDVSRLLSRLHRRTPTGIDRVEFAYARHYLGRRVKIDAHPLVTTPVNTGLPLRSTVSRLMEVAEERWGTASEPHADWQDVVDILQSPIWVKQPRAPKVMSRSGAVRTDRTARAVVRRAYVEATLRGAFGDVPSTDEPSWYLHVSHINLHDPRRFRWMRAAPGLRKMFLVHDLIPVSHPEYFLPGEAARHQTRMATIARLADVVIFNSRSTHVEWSEFIAANKLPAPPGAVVPLGTEEAFLNAGTRLHADVLYFVVVGTLESRKNLSFLLHIWKEWIRSHPIPHARLVIVGRRGRHSENTIDLIDRSTALASTVVEIGELEDEGLAVLMRGALALLAPSLIEGFGLPIAEALALRVPVIASDIAAHREVGGDCAEYLDPLDGPAWLRALDEYAAPSSTRRDAMQRATLGYRAMTWEEHLRTVEDILRDRT